MRRPAGAGQATAVPAAHCHSTPPTPSRTGAPLSALIEYLATVPFPVHFGVAVLRLSRPSTHHPSPPCPSRSTTPPRPAAHPGGSGALGGPGHAPGPLPTRPGPHAAPPPISKPATAAATPDKPRPRRRPAGHNPGSPRAGHSPGHVRAGHNPDAPESAPVPAHRPNAASGNPSQPTPRTTGPANARQHPSWPRCRHAPGSDGLAVVGAAAARQEARALGICPKRKVEAVDGGNGCPCLGEGAGERVGRAGAGSVRAGSDGGRRDRLPTFGGRPAMAYPPHQPESPMTGGSRPGLLIPRQRTHDNGSSVLPGAGGRLGTPMTTITKSIEHLHAAPAGTAGSASSHGHARAPSQTCWRSSGASRRR
jgi:hypothetical protein